MQASFLDLRKRMKDILAALDRNEEVTIFYRGKPRAILKPIRDGKKKYDSVGDHPACGMWADREDMKDVDAYVREMRKGRYDDLR